MLCYENWYVSNYATDRKKPSSGDLDFDREIYVNQ